MVINSWLNQDETLWISLAQAREAMLKARRKDLSRFSMSTPRQAIVLRIIHHLGNKATLKEISQHAYREIPSIYLLTNRLEEKGLLRKIRDIPGTTAVRYEITGEGLKVLDQVLESDSIHRIMSALTEGEKQELGSILQKLIKASMEVQY